MGENNLEVINLTKKIATLKKEEDKYVVDYGKIRKNSNSKIHFVIKSDKKLTNIRVDSSCGCTEPVFYMDKGEVNFKVSYDTKRLGTFSKRAYFRYGSSQDRKVIIFNLKGEVK